MKNYFYKLNEKYIKSFTQNVHDRFFSHNIRSETNFLKSLFIELNELFRKIGGRLSSKNNIPDENDYPDSEVFNGLITDITHDIDKIYTSQALIEDDVQNLLNFNSSQRSRIFENLMNVQQNVLSLYIRNKAGIKGEEVRKETFESQDSIGPESNSVIIDERRGVLTLSKQSVEVKPVDLRGVRIIFSGEPPKTNLFPNNKTLAVGSHWKIPNRSEIHFIDFKSESETNNYKELMIDNPDNSLGVGHTQFEAVKTLIDPTPRLRQHTTSRVYDIGWQRIKNSMTKLYTTTDILNTIKTYIGEKLGKDSNLIYADLANSLQKEYSSEIILEEPNLEFKLIIPFNEAPITNSVTIHFEANNKGLYPSVIWDKSKVFSNTSNQDIAYGMIKPRKNPDNGEYNCLFTSYISPSRLELILKYDGESWSKIPFIMANYQYSANRSYELPHDSSETIRITLSKTYDIYVDAEANLAREQTRAKEVLAGTLRRS